MTKEKSSTTHKILTVIGTILCIILIPVLIINLTLIAKSFINKDQVPSVGGVFPLIVLSDSMYPVIESGDLIICQTADPEDIRVNDVISFFDPEGSGTAVITHRVIEILENEQGLSFKTKGDNNNTEDKRPVPAENLVGVYNTRVPGAGNVALFMQSTPGLIICVVVPIVLLVGYDMLRRRQYEQENQKDTKRLLAELEELRALKAEKEKQNTEE